MVSEQGRHDPGNSNMDKGKYEWSYAAESQKYLIK